MPFSLLSFPTQGGWFLIVGYIDDMENQISSPPGQHAKIIEEIYNKHPFANWSANVRVFIAPMVEHCSANAEAMGSSPFFFFGFICHCLTCNYHSDDDVFI